MVQSARAESPLTHEKSSHPGRITARSYKRSASKFLRATRAGTHVLDVDRGNWRPMQAKWTGDKRVSAKRQRRLDQRPPTALSAQPAQAFRGPPRSLYDRRPPSRRATLLDQGLVIQCRLGDRVSRVAEKIRRGRVRPSGRPRRARAVHCADRLRDHPAPP